MNDELNKALEQISDDHINEAAHYRKPRFLWLRAVAAVLAVVIAWTAIWAAFDFAPTIVNPKPTDPILQGPTLPTAPTSPSDPTQPTDPRPTIPSTPKPEYPTNLGDIQSPDTLQLTNLVAAPKYPEMVKCPVYEDYADYKDYNNALVQWYTCKGNQYNQPVGYADSLTDFWAKSIPEFLSGEGNRAYSPANVYLALAMLAEVTGGNSRQQVLDLLGVDSIEALRTQAGHVWNAHYSNDGKTTSLLANSLWLDGCYEFKDEAVQNLINNYFASVFNGDLGTEDMNEQLRAWINSQTGGLLQEQAKNLELSSESVFALASTIYFAADWEGGFNKDKTADGVFHCKDGDLTTAFMNKTITEGVYYWGEDFGAVRLGLSKGSMWLILPDEGKTVEDVLESGEYLQLTLSPNDWKNQKKIKINLSMPKFDISSQADLIEGMKNLGLTDVFNSHTANFTPMTDVEDLALGKIDHAVRVAIDEEGVIAAAYTVMDIPAGCVPTIPDKEIDFILDRPFLFTVSTSIPLFAGVVEQP